MGWLGVPIHLDRRRAPDFRKQHFIIRTKIRLKVRRHTPFVSDPKKAFEILADPLVTRTVQSLFHPQRIQYFFSSSIGFYAPPNSPISLEDYGNICYLPGGSKIRSGRDTFPVNVFTPLMWIESQISVLDRNQPATR